MEEWTARFFSGLSAVTFCFPALVFASPGPAPALDTQLHSPAALLPLLCLPSESGQVALLLVLLIPSCPKDPLQHALQSRPAGNGFSHAFNVLGGASSPSVVGNYVSEV